MVYKLYNQNGNYEDITTKEPKNMQKCNTAHTPQGINVGWTEFATDEEAMVYFNIQKKEVIPPVNQPVPPKPR